MRLIRAKDYRRMPWKNGGGETIEIAVHPRGSDTSSFDWRISMARVEENGPFSIFPGMDRTLAILDGQGIDLSIEGQGTARIYSAPLAFAGDVPTSASLVDGPVTDLNVMTRRGKFQNRVTRLELSNPREIVVMSPVALMYCHRGRIAIEQEFVSPVEVSEGETLFIEAMPNGLALQPLSPSTIFLIEIVPVQGT
ncbi:MAG: HutD family protein [Rhizobiaceae bacterium]|nr:HutD family protein [Rhizobiaceae bacterium]